MDKENQTQHPILSWKKSVLTIVGAIVLGAIGSGLWEMLAKPGLSRLGRLFLTVVTFGSESAKNKAYADAALDPTAIPSLVLLLHFYAIPIYLIVAYITYRLLDQHLKTKADVQTKSGKYRAFAIAALVLFIGGASWGFVRFLTINQSILIHRVFNTNLRICSPHITEGEERSLRSRFAAIRTKADYIVIDKDIKKISQSNGATLVDIELW